MSVILQLNYLLPNECFVERNDKNLRKFLFIKHVPTMYLYLRSAAKYYWVLPIFQRPSDCPLVL